MDVELEMGLSLAEIERTLPRAVEPFEVRSSSDGYALRNAHGEVLRLRVTSLPARRIAALNLPRTRVRIQSDDLDAAAELQFMQRFHRYFHRGGG